MSFTKKSTDRIPSILGGGFDWSKCKKNTFTQTSKPTLQQKQKTTPLITSFLGYRRSMSKRIDEQVSLKKEVSVETPGLSSDPNQLTSAFVPPTLEN